MRKSLERLATLRRHLLTSTQHGSISASPTQCNNGPALLVTPSSCLVDEKIKIHLDGLGSNQLVTLVADVTENGTMFEARCLYQADSNGEIDNCSNASLAGSFKGIEQMGLFWSIQPEKKNQRLVKKDVTEPMKFTIRAFLGDHTEVKEITAQPITEAVVKRFFMKPGVKRIPLTTGKVLGTIFIPEGEGPFPGLTDMFGGLVSLIETRAALLASHGYATLALSYLYREGLPSMVLDTDMSYILEAYKWFSSQPYVDQNRLGAVGLCFGGFLSLCLAVNLPQIRCVVNVNGTSAISADSLFQSHGILRDPWLKSSQMDRIIVEDEGVVIRDVYNCEVPAFIQAWQHGAKILIIAGEDDKQVNHKWHSLFKENCPDEHKDAIQIYSYPGAGHLIEPPYMPHVRVVEPGKKRMQTLDFMHKKYFDKPLMVGGFPEEHAHAQEDSWEKTLHFLHVNLKSL